MYFTPLRSISIKPLCAALVVTVALAGCDMADKPKSEDEVRDELSRMVKPQAGLYRSTSKLVSFDVPGMPPAQAERLKQMFSTQQAREFCLTKAQAEKGYEEMTKQLAQGNCKADRFTADGNTLDAKLTCETGKEMKATIEMNGTISEQGSQMKMTVNQNAPGGRSINMVAEVASQRVGDCPGS